MKLKIPNTVTSPEDLKEIVNELKEYGSWWRKNAIKLKVAKKNVPDKPELTDAAGDLLRQWEPGAKINANEIDKLVSELEHYLAHAPRIRVILPALPNLKTKELFTKWFRDNLSETILVDYQLNSTMLGGMAINFGSHIYDWSFRRQIMQNKDKFVGVVRNV